MLISDEELDKRLSAAANLTNSPDYQIHNYQRGRQGGEKSIPPELKKVVAILGHEGKETQKELGSVFGMGQQAVSRLSRGKESLSGTNGEIIDDSLTEVLSEVEKRKNNMRSEAEEKALNSLLTSLNFLPDKLQDASVKELSIAAKSMADVADKMSNRKKNEDEGKHVHLHLYTPNMKSLSDYEVIEAEVVK